MVVGMRASDITVCIDATASFNLKLKIKKVRENRIRTAIKSLMHLSFGIKKVRLGGEVSFTERKLDLRPQILQKLV